jgi:hypothetical protein
MLDITTTPTMCPRCCRPWSAHNSVCMSCGLTLAGIRMQAQELFERGYGR